MNFQPRGLGHLLEDASALEAFSGKRRWILALDYDGTLAPFRPEREHARPYAGMLDVLNRLPAEGANRFVIVSGRDARDIARLLGIHPVPEIWGCHGAQRMAPGREPQAAPLTPRQEEAVRQACALVDDPRLVEVKPCGLAVHWRGLPPERRERLEAGVASRLRELAGHAGLELHAFDGGLELRLPGVDKGAAIDTLLRENPDALVFYLGDDQTDEDAFQALEGRGVGVLVRSRPRPTRASYRISPPQELLTLLGRFTSSRGLQRRIIRAQ